MGSSRMMWSTAEMEVAAAAGVIAAPRAAMDSADDDAADKDEAGEDCADST
jgi:hypothetical protein